MFVPSPAMWGVPIDSSTPASGGYSSSSDEEGGGPSGWRSQRRRRLRQASHHMNAISSTMNMSDFDSDDSPSALSPRGAGPDLDYTSDSSGQSSGNASTRAIYMGHPNLLPLGHDETDDDNIDDYRLHGRDEVDGLITELGQESGAYLFDEQAEV